VEDLVAAFLQATRGYIALPARYAKSNAVYEYVLKQRDDGHLAVVQVKTGSGRVAADQIDERAADKWFVYTDGSQELPAFVDSIDPNDLIAYMESGAQSLPPVTERWMRRVGPSGS
jgi:hypothetical protein